MAIRLAAMANVEGTPVWYELLTNDAHASTAFYEEVIGWNVTSPDQGDVKGYRMFEVGSSTSARRTSTPPPRA